MLVARDASNNLKISGNGVTAEVSLADPSQDRTSTNNLLAYRPHYNDYHQSGLAAVFINLSDLFPCTASEQPRCYRATWEEDGFNKGKAILKAGDIGNNFNVWPNGQKRTYGFVIEGCEELNTQCLPSYYQISIICHLSRPLCG